MSRIPTTSTLAKINYAYCELTDEPKQVWASMYDMKPAVYVNQIPTRQSSACAGVFTRKISLRDFVREVHFTLEQLRRCS